ncbi:hypothetical protein N7520_005515 [Penicillium odoratum]|uniref:uncharacterized protein n=1 Tax=Penicillium odoratum TaxID=1167516 RepID=UPI00254791CD|nr:uncharacterized protein N7520_010222 [Penicillium odoratum]XP_056997656.1 uncharacterized protein N7520_005515 [Penicillium odoratum]KAJ5753305.1 hypothetical protein N7520_010222 [Penicillium odoratum]KAJ5765956.1 hypothetical protein N7520_005515 [Penicillium odoratum]
MSLKAGTDDKGKSAPEATPSASVILISSINEVLLLQRTKTSSSFPSAHVFPGGNLDLQDGECPPQGDPKRHEDSIVYRRAALRELFEETGILLARDKTSGNMMMIDENKRNEGRKAIHSQSISFLEWLKKENNGLTMEPDTGISTTLFLFFFSILIILEENLIPFTRWVTPYGVPHRYTTQMYLYFLPIPHDHEQGLDTEMPIHPYHDGGVEITDARFLESSEWLRKARAGQVKLLPPQHFLLSVASQFLDTWTRSRQSLVALRRQRRKLQQFLNAGSPPWTHICISPTIERVLSDGRALVRLDKPGPELEGSDRSGVKDRVMLVKFGKAGPSDFEIILKEDIDKSKI